MPYFISCRPPVSPPPWSESNPALADWGRMVKLFLHIPSGTIRQLACDRDSSLGAVWAAKAPLYLHPLPSLHRAAVDLLTLHTPPPVPCPNLSVQN